MSKIGNLIAESILDEIRRDDMPQIAGKDIDKMLDIFNEYGIPYQKGKARCDELRPVQENYSPSKVEKFIKMFSEEGKECHPILVSNDGYIIDGHHRWLAKKEMDEDAIGVIKLGYPKAKAWKLVHGIALELSEAVDECVGLIEEFIVQRNQQIIKEVTQAANGSVDDGPNTFYRNFAHYKDDIDNVAEHMGFQIINYLTGDKQDDFVDFTHRYDVVPVVSFGDSGVRPQVPNARSRWKEYVTKVAKRLGYEFLDWYDYEFEATLDPETPSQIAEGVKKNFKKK